jgi:predicted dehydrogenase
MQREFLFLAVIMSVFIAAAAGASAEEPSKVLRAGMIGLDTSHVPAFTKLFNHPNAESDLSAVRIVAGYPGGTDIPASRDRVERFTEQIREMGVKIVPTIPDLLAKVDVVLLESVDGRIHFQEAVEVIRAGKPLFIDKPLAGSLADAIAIFDLAAQHNVPCFSSSSLRFGPAVQGALGNEELGDIAGVVTWGSCSYQAGIPDMFFYGIHGIEMLYTLMGPGCETLTRTHTRDTDVITGVWSDGRIGTYRGIRKHKATFGATLFGTAGIATIESDASYKDLCVQIGRFFKTGIAPVDPQTTIELFAFMEAADESRAPRRPECLDRRSDRESAARG